MVYDNIVLLYIQLILPAKAENTTKIEMHVN